MSMPVPPVAAVANNAPATAAADAGATSAEEDDDKKAAASAIKQFGPSEDADGNPIPVPKPEGVSMDEITNEMFSALTASLAKRGITDVESFIETAEALDKTTFPGNKIGRVSYNTIRAIANVFKQYALLNKQRGVGGAGAMKKKLEEKENKINELEAKLAALMAKLGVSA